MPIVDAIARGIPVVALDTAVNHEIRSVTDGGRLFLVTDFGQLRSVVSNIVANPPVTPPKQDRLRTWEDVAWRYAPILRGFAGPGAQHGSHTTTMGPAHNH